MTLQSSTKPGGGGGGSTGARRLPRQRSHVQRERSPSTRFPPRSPTSVATATPARIDRSCRMTGRDRIVVIGIAVLVVLGAAWLLVVSPERKQAAALSAQVSAASAQLQTADSQLANARSAQTQYAAAYASIVRLGKAVPPSEEVPSLMYQIAQASNQKDVEFSSITTTGAAVEHRGRRRGHARAGVQRPRRLHADAVHVRLQRELLRPLPPVPAARPLHRAHHLRRAHRQRSPAHDRRPSSWRRARSPRASAPARADQNSCRAPSRRPRTCCRPARDSPPAGRRAPPRQATLRPPLPASTPAAPSSPTAPAIARVTP